MKVRKGFISNSSSCSFVFKLDEPLTEEKAKEFFKDYEYELYWIPDQKSLLEDWLDDHTTIDKPYEIKIQSNAKKGIVKIPRDISAKYMTLMSERIDPKKDIDLLYEDFDEDFFEYLKTNHSDLLAKIDEMNKVLGTAVKMEIETFTDPINQGNMLKTIKELEGYLPKEIRTKIQELIQNESYQEAIDLVYDTLNQVFDPDSISDQIQEIEDKFKTEYIKTHQTKYNGKYLYKLDVEGSGNGWADIHSNSIYEKPTEEVFTEKFLKDHLIQQVPR